MKTANVVHYIVQVVLLDVLFMAKPSDILLAACFVCMQLYACVYSDHITLLKGLTICISQTASHNGISPAMACHL